MSCADKRDALTAYADGRCAAAEAAALEGHLAGCSGCRAELDWQKSAKAALARLPLPPMPAGLKDELRALARDAQAARRRRAWKRRWEAVVDLLRPRAGLGLAAGLAAAMLAFALRPAPEEAIPLEEMLAAHRAYAMSMPLAAPEAAAAGYADALAGEP